MKRYVVHINDPDKRFYLKKFLQLINLGYLELNVNDEITFRVHKSAFTQKEQQIMGLYSGEMNIKTDVIPKIKDVKAQ